MNGWPDNNIPTNTGWEGVPLADPGLTPSGYQPRIGQSGSGGGLPIPRGTNPWPGTPIHEPLQGAWNLPSATNAAVPAALKALGLDWDDLAKLGIAGASVIGGATGGGGDMPPEIRELLELQRRRLMAGNPLYESVLRLAFSRLPTDATQGLSIPGIGG